MSVSSSEVADAKLVHAYLRALAVQRKAHSVGPFVVRISPVSESPHSNYAIPDDFAEPSAEDVVGLIALFREHQRQPRLEFIPAAAPSVEAMLLEAGFEVELRPPMMVMRPLELPKTPSPEGFSLTFTDDPVTLRAIVRVQRQAFGDKPISGEIDVSGLERDISRGGQYLAVTATDTGAVVGAGAYMPPQLGVTEVVGIAVSERYRRRGLGQVITAALAQQALGLGCEMTFLAPAGEAQEAIYARAGFVSGTPMLYVSVPNTLREGKSCSWQNA
jgi:GNAT superfamily N-acetyltransferase